MKNYRKKKRYIAEKREFFNKKMMADYEKCDDLYTNSSALCANTFYQHGCFTVAIHINIFIQRIIPSMRRVAKCAPYTVFCQRKSRFILKFVSGCFDDHFDYKKA